MHILVEAGNSLQWFLDIAISRTTSNGTHEKRDWTPNYKSTLYVRLELDLEITIS